MAMNWLWVTIGNLAGSLFVAYFLADQTGVLGSGDARASSGSARSPRARPPPRRTGSSSCAPSGCNWLVCLAVWLALAATDIGGKILAIIFPITAFVALGFDHVVANMFFLPAAMFLNTGDVSGGQLILNLIMAFLGNAVGAGLFVAGAYWYLYGSSGRAPAATGATNGAVAPPVPDRAAARD